MGDFGHSNVVDEDLNMQPDQNKGDVMGGGTSGVENVGVVGDFGHSNISSSRCRTSVNWRCNQWFLTHTQTNGVKNMFLEVFSQTLPGAS